MCRVLGRATLLAHVSQQLCRAVHILVCIAEIRFQIRQSRELPVESLHATMHYLEVLQDARALCTDIARRAFLHHIDWSTHRLSN